MRLVPRIAGMSSKLTMRRGPRSARMPRRRLALGPVVDAAAPAFGLTRVLHTADFGRQPTPDPSEVPLPGTMYATREELNWKNPSLPFATNEHGERSSGS